MRNPPTTLLIYNSPFFRFVIMSVFSSVFRLLSLAALLLTLAPAAQAQGGRRAQRLGQLENAKIAFITNRVSLTQDQAQKFWPLYNEFSARRRELNRNGRLLRRDITEGMTDQQLRENFTQSFNSRQQELNLEKEYFEKFQKVISLRQVAQLFQAERDFTKEVIKRVANVPGQVGSGND
jgi:Spy/CpxP family protein refolding chaperone